MRLGRTVQVMRAFCSLVLISSALCASAQSQSPVTSPESGHRRQQEKQRILAILDARLAEAPGVGIALGIVDAGGARVYCRGRKDVRHDAAVDGDTIFELASVTKVFTGTIFADMVRKGEVKMDDRAQNYLPPSVKMPTWKEQPITLLHLANHVSGLPSYATTLTSPDPLNPYANYTKEQIYGFLNKVELQRAPGESYLSTLR